MRLLFLTGFLSLCFSTLAQESQYQSLLLDKSLTDNANAVIRLNQRTIEIPSISEMIIKKRRIVTVLNKNGNKHINGHTWYDNNRKVKNIEAYIYDAAGNRIKKIKEKDFQDVSSVEGGTLYTDTRLKYMTYTPIEYPYTVEFICEMVTNNTVHIPSWSVIEDFEVSIEKNEFNVYYSNEVGINTKEVNFDNTIEKISEDGELRYTATNIEAIKQESMSPDLEQLIPTLKITPKNFNYEGYQGQTGNWKDIGKWMHDKLLFDRTELPEITKTKIKTLVKDIDIPIEKAKKIYQYVQNNTRYISVQEGVGGIQPISAAEVDRVKYGDCKGLTNYTKALLEVVGIKSNYTRVYASRNEIKDIDEEFPTFLGQSNHVILNIPQENNSPIWLECTSQVQPFGFLGQFTDDRKVFVVTEDGGYITKTPSFENNQNHRITKVVCRLDAEGSIIAEISMLSKGLLYDRRFHLEDFTNEEIKTYYKDYWSGINNLRIDEFQFENNREDFHFEEKIQVKALDYLSKSGERILFTPNIFNKNDFIPKRYRDRNFPFEILRGYLHEDEFVIEIPKGYKVEAIPDNTILKTNYGKYEISIEIIGENKIKYKRGLLIKKGLFPKEDYGAYRNFRKKISKLDNNQIVLIKK